MDSLAVIGAPALVAWGISVEHRCISSFARRLLGLLVVVLECWLIAGILVGGAVAFAAYASCLLAIALVEALLAFNVIPSARRFRTLFYHLPLDLRILASGGLEVFRTSAARKLDATTLHRLAAAMPKDNRSAVLHVRTTLFPDAVFKLYRPHAGVALLTENTSELNKLRRQLEQRRDVLVSQNELLRSHHAMRTLLYRQQRERELGERVERDLAAAATQIREILDNRIVGDGDCNSDERIKQLNLVKVLVAYCKRKGMLALAGAESTTMDGEQISMIARESMADLKSIGIECAILVATSDPVSTTAINTVYDSFYDCIISVLPRVNPVLMVYISQNGSGTLEMSANIECAIGLEAETAVDFIPRIATSTEPWTAVQAEIARELDDRLATRGGDYSICLEDGLVSVVVRAYGPSPAPRETPPDCQAPRGDGLRPPAAATQEDGQKQPQRGNPAKTSLSRGEDA